MGEGTSAFRDLRRAAPFGAVALCFALASCNSSGKFASNVDPRYGVASSPRVIDFGQPVPKGGGSYRVGKPYTVAGRTYVPEENLSYRGEGLASWYGTDFHGRLTANGEVFDMESISAAHPTLPLPSYVRVTNLSNRRSLIVRVNDRGPYHGDRVIDLSHKAADLLGFKKNGVARVEVEYVGRASLAGSDDRKLIATLRDGQPAPAPVMLASAGPFVPQSSRASPIIRGTIPLPSERPYSIGQPQPEMQDKRVAATDMAALSRTSRKPEAALPSVSPASAFAPARYDAPAAFISGRGIY